ncbi:MAG: hypothetical protein MHM6MM_004017 [Cercozoa sp. M6MM]
MADEGRIFCFDGEDTSRDEWRNLFYAQTSKHSSSTLKQRKDLDKAAQWSQEAVVKSSSQFKQRKRQLCTERCFVRSTSSSRRSLDLVSQSTSGRLLFDDRDNSSDFDSDESEFSCTNSVFSALPLDVGDTEDRYSPSRHYPRAEFNVEQAHFNRFREREARRTSPADHESFVAELLFRVTEVESKILQRQQSANTERRDLLKEMQKLRASGKSRQRAIEDLRVEIEAHEQLSENRRATAALRKQRQRRRFKLRRVRAWIEEFNKLQKHEEENKLGSESQLRQLPTSLKVFLRERQRIFDRESIDNAATSDELLQLSQPTLSEHPMLWLAWRQARHCAERESLQRSLSQLLDKQSESTKTLPQASRKLFALQTLVGNTYDLAVLALDRQKRRNERRQRRLSGLRNSNDALRKRVAATQLALQQALLLTSK